MNVEGFYVLYELTLHYAALQYSPFCMKTDIGQFLYIYEVLIEATTFSFSDESIKLIDRLGMCIYVCVQTTNPKVDLLCVDNKSESRSIACRQQIRK